MNTANDWINDYPGIALLTLTSFIVFAYCVFRFSELGVLCI